VIIASDALCVECRRDKRRADTGLDRHPSPTPYG
jgi:hypothetical protein